jgi:hypothetical protein
MLLLLLLLLHVLVLFVVVVIRRIERALSLPVVRSDTRAPVMIKIPVCALLLPRGQVLLLSPQRLVSVFLLFWGRVCAVEPVA